jgi:hypothetical protein
MGMPQPKQILWAVWAGVAGVMGVIRAWWRDAKSDRERRVNLVFLATSATLTLVTVGAFFWVSGSLDFRGSDGRTNLEFIFQCDREASKTEPDDCWKSLESTNKFEVNLDLEPRHGQRDTLDVNLGFASLVDNKLIQVLTKATKLQIISNRAYDVSPAGQVTHSYEGNWSSTLLQPAMPATLTFVRGSLTHYTALSEREVTIAMDFVHGGTVFYGKRTLSLRVFPPNGFDIVEASSSAERDSSGRYWTMQLASDTGDFVFRVRMRNFEAARLDHILDSSIAALLGVAAGGVMTACLSLALLRRRRDVGEKRDEDKSRDRADDRADRLERDLATALTAAEHARKQATDAQERADGLTRGDSARRARGRLRRAWDGWRGR